MDWVLVFAMFCYFFSCSMLIGVVFLRKIIILITIAIPITIIAWFRKEIKLRFLLKPIVGASFLILIVGVPFYALYILKQKWFYFVFFQPGTVIGLSYFFVETIVKLKPSYYKTLEQLEKYKKLSTKGYFYYCYKGTFKIKLGDNKGAIEDFTKAIELNPNDAEAYGNRGIAKVNLRDNIGAIKDFTKAIELNPNAKEAYSNRGIAKVNLGDNKGAIEDLTKAIEDYTKAIELNPNDAKIYYNRGIAKNILGDNKDAIEDFTKAKDLCLKQQNDIGYKKVIKTLNQIRK